MNSTKKIYVDYKNLEKYLRLKSPYIFVDNAEIYPGVRAVGKKYYSNNEWYFKSHYPDNPIVPCGLLLESLMETAALCIYTLDDENVDFVYPQKFFNFEVLKQVHPGELMTVEAKIESFKRGILKAVCAGYLEKNFTREQRTLCCRATFQSVVPKMLELSCPKRTEVSK